MGYYTTLTGFLDIEPPIPYKILEQSPFRRFDDDAADFFLITPDGRTVIPVQGYIKAYGAEKKLQKLIDAFPEHTFSGFIEGNGEEPGDLWRLYAKNGRVFYVEPEVTYILPEDD